MVADILFWLAPIGILQSLNSSTGSILMAKGKTSILFFLGIIGAFLTLSAFLISSILKLDIIGFCKLYFFANIINFSIATYVVCKVIKLSILEYLKPIFSITVSSFLLFLLLLFMGSYIYFSFILKIIIGIIFYCILLCVIPNKIIFGILKSKLRYRRGVL